MEAEGYFYAIRLKGNSVLQNAVAHLLKRPVGRPPNYVRRFYHDFEYRAASWEKARRVIAKVEWHPGDLFPRVGFVVTNLPMEPDWIIRFYNQRGTAEQHIKQGKYAICAGLQSRQLPWPCRSARRGCRLVADKYPKPPHQNRRTGRAPCPQNHLPTG